MHIEINPQNKIIAIALVALAVGSGVAINPLVSAVGIAILVAGTIGLFAAYKWPEFFLILALWTYFLKFTFIFSIIGLGITPFMIFLALAVAGYGLRIFCGKQRLILPVGLGFLIIFISFTTLSLLVVRNLETAVGAYFRTTLDWLLMLLLIQMITDRKSLKRLLVALLVQAVVVISWGLVDAIQSIADGRTLLTGYSSYFWNQFRKNDFAVYLAFISLLSFVVLLRGRNKAEKLLSILLLVSIPVGWFITRSRSGLLALVLSLFIFFVLERNGKLLRILLAFLLLGIVSFAIFPSQERDLALDGIRALINPEDVISERNVETVSRRFELMEAGWQVFTNEPILGVGFNQWQFYSPISNARRDPRTGERIEDPLEIHNRFFQIATNNGIFALMGYLGFVATLLFSGMLARRTARGFIRTLLNALIAMLLTVQIVFTVMTGFLWEWPIFGILISVIYLVEIETVGELAKRKRLSFRSYGLADLSILLRQEKS